jgi:hypothetical protein
LTTRSLFVPFLSLIASALLTLSAVVPQAAQGTTPTCAQGGECVIGDIGPGGGQVYAVTGSPFACGPTRADLCQGFEVAPQGWASANVAIDPVLPFAIAPFDAELANASGTDFGSQFPDGYIADLGFGLPDSLSLIAQQGACQAISTCGYAAGAANLYRGGGLSDWSLPSREEANALINHAGDLDARTDLSPDDCSNHVPDCLWTSWQANSSNATNITIGAYSAGFKAKSDLFHVRPVRAILWGSRTEALQPPGGRNAFADGESTTAIQVRFDSANNAASTTITLYSASTGGSGVPYPSFSTDQLITGLIPDTDYWVTWQSIGHDYFTSSDETARMLVHTNRRESVTPTITAASMIFGTTAPTIGYTTTNPDQFDTFPSCDLYSASDTSFQTVDVLDSSTPVGDYVVHCIHAWGNPGFLYEVGADLNFAVIDPNRTNSPPAPAPQAPSEPDSKPSTTPTPSATPEVTASPTPSPSGGSSSSPQKQEITLVKILGFSPGSTFVSPSMKLQIRRVLSASPLAVSLTCVGVTSGPKILSTDKNLAKNRATAACGYALSFNSNLKIRPSRVVTTKLPGKLNRRVELILGPTR